MLVVQLPGTQRARVRLISRIFIFFNETLTKLIVARVDFRLQILDEECFVAFHALRLLLQAEPILLLPLLLFLHVVLADHLVEMLLIE